MKLIGIDIGSNSVKVAEVEVSGKEIFFSEAQIYPLTSKDASDRDLEIVTTLKEALTRYQSEDMIRYVIGLPQDKVSVRKLSFPFKEKYKILKSLPFEMEDLTPFSLENTIYDAKVLRKTAHETEVLGMAVSKETIQSYLNVAKDCGIDPDIVSIEGFGLNNLFEDIFSKVEVDSALSLEDHEDLDEEEEVDTKSPKIKENQDFKPGEAILNIGHSSTLLVVRSDKTLTTVRRINWGASRIMNALAHAYNIQFKDAKAMLEASKGLVLNKSSATEKEQKISEIISQEIQPLGKSLYLTLLEVRGSHGVEVKGMGLLGGLSQLKNLGPKLTQHVNVPCNKVTQIKQYPQLDLSDPKLSVASVAFGLALEGARKPSNPAINFRREEFSKENSQLKKLWSDWGFYVKLAAASIALFFVHAQMRSTITEDLALEARRSMKDAAAKILNVNKMQASERKLKTILNNMDAREQLKAKIVDYSRQAPSPLKLLKKINEKSSSKTNFPMSIERLILNKEQVEIVGRTKSRRELSAFSKKLESLSEGKVNSTSRIVQDNNTKLVQFNISFKPKSSVM